ncbi:neuropeptide Y receptor type 5-like [Octopus sinensis]|uniref:Neuropeptide Y receptor type 5-like n=1 Tax=Octopus sinensis TaxID=2607531 RepID=A0A7E6FKG1_9MOLL|nr:neuropeptide Y receptor type 5-like [Octopus sinensis]
MMDVIQKMEQDVRENNDTVPRFNQTLSVKDFQDILSENNHWMEPSTEVCLIVAYSLVMIFGIVSNFLVCYVVYRNKQLWYPLNFLIVNLAVCDVFLSFSLPLTLSKLILQFWIFGNIMCKITSAVQTLVTFVSTFTIVSIAIERYHIIVNNKNRGKTNQAIVVGNILVIWTAALCLSIPMFIFHRVDKKEIIPTLLVYEICIETWSSYVARATFTSCLVLLQYLFPLILIIAMHYQIYNYLRQQILKSFIYDKRTIKIYKRNKRNLIILTTTTMTFAITWLPVTILNVLVDYDHRLFGGSNFNLTYSICLLIAISSVSINPIVYGLLNSKFRAALSDISPFTML